MNNHEPELVVICTVNDEITANVIKSHLESEGIPVFLKLEAYSVGYGSVAGSDHGPTSVLVPGEFAKDAKLIIEPKEPLEDDESYISCPQCGALLTNGTDIFCDKCGDRVPATEFASLKPVTLNCPKCGTFMTEKYKHERKRLFAYFSSTRFSDFLLGCLLAPVTLLGLNKDYFICPQCGKKTVVPNNDASAY